MPRWAFHGRDRRLFPRHRLVWVGALVSAFAFILWLNYPFLPNYRVLLFNQPTTQATSGSTPGNWTMAGGDVAQRKVAPLAAHLDGKLRGQELWKVPLGTATRSGPVVYDGRVYLGGHFKVLAVDAETGAVIWERPAAGPVQSSPALAGGSLFVGLPDHRLVALDPANGETRWEYKTGDMITAAPVVHRGIVYVGSWDNRLYALDAATGESIWTYAATETIGSLTPVDDGTLAVGDRNGQVHLLNARTGQNRLVYRTPKSASSAPVIAYDMVYFAAGGRLYGIDATEREIPGQYQFKRVWAQLWLWQAPRVPPPALQQAGRWRFSPDGADSSIVAAPAAADAYLYVGDLQGRLYALNPLTGREAWRIQVAGGIYASPIAAGENVYFATQAGKVYAVDTRNRTVIWEHSVDAAVNQPLAFAGGKLYVRTDSGVLYALR